MSARVLEKFKEALIDGNVVSAERLRELEQKSRDQRVSLKSVLLENKIVSEEDLARIIGEGMEIPYVDLKRYTIDPRALEVVPDRVARRLTVLPLFLIEESLTVAVTDPFDLIALDEITSISGYRVEPVVASPDGIRNAIDQWYGVGEEKRRLIDQLASEVKSLEREKRIHDYDEETVIRHVREVDERDMRRRLNQILVQAVVEDATEVHFEPKKSGMEIRFRIDGVLFQRFSVTNEDMELLITRAKMLASLNLQRRTVPQEGRFGFELRNRAVDIQASTYPSLFGETMVLNLSDRGRGAPGLIDLGLSDPHLGAVEKVAHAGKGLVLVSGSAGCGKSTTIYAALKALAGSDRKIMTVEDPVKHELGGIIQGQVDIDAGFTFPKALRTLRLQDPDVLYASSFDDPETAHLLIQGALGGQLVFTRCHASNAFEAVSRLTGMRVNVGFLESVLKCSINQRLVRRICSNCREEYAPAEALLEGLDLGSQTTFFRGRGCPYCCDTGYRGMLGVFEIMVVNRELRKLLANFASEDEIMEASWSYGMKSLFEDGIAKVVGGSTTIDEIKRVLGTQFAAQVSRETVEAN